jgi:hypothetical protein
MVIQTEGKGAGRMAVPPDGKWATASHTTTQDVVLINAASKEIAADSRSGRWSFFAGFLSR